MPNSRHASVITAAALLFTASAWASAQSLTRAATGLSFGQVIAGALPGSVRVSASGFRSTAGATFAGNGLGVSAASFTVASAPNAQGSSAWSVMLPVTATISSGKAEMTIDEFEYTWSAAGGGLGQGARTLTVGATLHVGARQPSADYAGGFSLTVAYN
jgi:Domain of unknown function (DUF4402)